MIDNVDVVVGRRIRARRRLLGYSQQDLGVACGVTFQQIHKYEAAVCRLSVVMLWKLAKALEVDIGYFFAALSEEEAIVIRRRERTMAQQVNDAA
ncbi:helix-turn-helix transcriptional regulator [Phenylobacterium sp.]|uniref:helix-turn-helix domain-containing protein n=1 Tax=Phenylobacterium sp. TaxID=1871053 RepID=UPI00121264F9|nr:helix-turn-helix transcriptional regulator [Phenylobacterium sp.]THD58684.1 MAG: XRE family transcriptional regulator [Phenylobacterium sp.]